MPASETSSLLLKTATPDLYRRNAFRLTGLPVTATVREVARQADKLKMLADLGGQAAEQLAVVPGMESPTVEEIREATQRLKEVEVRALDEFFWFWPEDWERPEADEAFVAIKNHDLDSAFAIWADREVETECLQANVIASHNIALVLHMRAIEWALSDLSHPLPSERISKVHQYWKDAFDRWEWLVDDDRLWDAFKARIRQVNDPALTTGLVRRIRGELPLAFAKINAELALSYAQQARREEAQWHVSFLRSIQMGQDDVEAVLDAVLAPVHARFKRAVDTAWQGTRAERRSGISQALTLLDSVEPLLAVFGMFHEQGSGERGRLFDEAAKAALGCAIDGYNTSNQALEKEPLPLGHALDPKKAVNEAFVKVLHRAEALAIDKELQQRIAQNIQTAIGNRQFNTKVKPVLDLLSAIQKLTTASPATRMDKIKNEVIPKLDALLQPGVLEDESRKMLGNSLAVVLRDIALSANNELQQPLLGMEALTLALRYARDPELVAKLKQDSQIMSQNLAAKGQQQTGQASDNGCVWAVVGGLVLLILIAIFNSESKSSKTTFNSPYKAPVPTVPALQAPQYQYPPPKIPPYQPPEIVQIPPLTPMPKVEISPDFDSLLALDRNGWHIWMNRESKKIVAKMLSYDGTHIVLETKDGKMHTYPVEQLSDESQKLVRLLNKEAASNLAPAAPAAPRSLPLPATGLYRDSSASMSSSGPLTILTRVGSGNFFVKLVESYTKVERMIIFVRDGTTAHDIDVPAGTYELRYASGKTWYGDELLFGPETSYSKAESDFTFGNGDGYTIELFKQVGGNLQTSQINKDNF